MVRLGELLTLGNTDHHAVHGLLDGDLMMTMTMMTMMTMMVVGVMMMMMMMMTTSFQWT